MKKKKLVDINFLSSIGVTNRASIKSLIKESKALKINIDQYILLVEDQGSSTALHNGIISFAKAGFDLSYISLFSIHKTSSGIITKSHGDGLSFFKVIFNNADYIAVKKPNINLGATVELISMNKGSGSAFEVADVDQLTDIVAI